MATRTDRAIVLRLVDFSETSQIASLFTAEGGLTRLIAKGVRRGTSKRFAVGLDLLEYGELSYAPARGGANLGTLTEWVQKDSFAGLRRDLLRLYAGLYAAELAIGLTEESDPHPELFESLLKLLQRLAGTEPEPSPSANAVSTAARPGDEREQAVAALIRFQWELLNAIGYAPNLRECVDCHKPYTRGPAHFSASAGGLLCRDCEMRHAEKRGLSATFMDQRARDPREWFSLLDYHLSFTAAKPFQTAARLTALIARQGPPRAAARTTP